MNSAGDITIHTHDGITFVRLSGEIDATMRTPAGTALGAALTLAQPVVLDLAHVTFIDSTGIAFLVQCHLCCHESGLTCQLKDVPEVTQEVLDVLGLDEVLADQPAH